MEATRDVQYKRLSELIFDEEQIVTSLSIANELKISARNAQNLLNDYVNDIRKEKSDDFHISYLLCGALKDKKGVGVYLVKEDDMEVHKCLFETISTEIIYSVQKGKFINFNLIASMNPMPENGLGFLVSKNCVKRDIKHKKLPVLHSAATASKPNVESKNSEPSTSLKSEKPMQENGKSHTHSSQKQKPKQNGGIASFFAKAATKTQNGTKSENPVKNEIRKQNGDVEVKQGTSKEQNTQAPAKAATKTQNSTKSENPVKNEIRKQSVEVEVKQSTSKEQNIQALANEMKVSTEDQKDQKSTSLKKVDENGTKKRKRGTKNNTLNKKRKRIQEICDSDSSDIFDDDENEDIIEMSDEEPAHVPDTKPVPVPKNKRRRAVDKTHLDEEGFMVTATEYVYESASEEEEKDNFKNKPQEIVLPLKRNEKMNAEPKPPANKGKSNKKQTSGKQPTLMSFFKRS